MAFWLITLLAPYEQELWTICFYNLDASYHVKHEGSVQQVYAELITTLSHVYIYEWMLGWMNVCNCKTEQFFYYDTLILCKFIKTVS
jgi:hypothetical protein